MKKIIIPVVIALVVLCSLVAVIAHFTIFSIKKVVGDTTKQTTSTPEWCGYWDKQTNNPKNYCK